MTGSSRQALYDAVKLVRDTGEAWVTFRGERLKLTSPTEVLAAESSSAVPAIIRRRGGWGMELAYVWWHEGRLHCQGDDSGFRRGNDDLVLAVVAERHPRVP
jgi:hypothetical protein